MRIRTKHWARPELAACPYYIGEPKNSKGKWSKLFANKAPLHLDLGCGKCTFLAELAHRNPDINFLGIDVSQDILGVARRNISEKYGEAPVSNVALCSYNIEKIGEILSGEDEVRRIYINFCNPWPNSGHHKRRLTHPRQLENYKALLKPGAELWFKTDNDDLFLATGRYLKESGFEILAETTDLASIKGSGNIQSEHELMFEAKGIHTKAIKAKLL